MTTPPDPIFLRTRGGEAVGPISLRELEVLFRTEIIGGATPVSRDGAAFVPLSSSGELWSRLATFGPQGAAGWAEELSPEDLPTFDALPVLLRLTAEDVGGVLTLRSSEGKVTLSYRDGVIVDVSTDIEERSFERFVLAAGIADLDAVSEARKEAGRWGGLGPALIQQGGAGPAQVVSAFADWATALIGHVIAWTQASHEFEIEIIALPKLSTGFDRLSPLLRATRVGLGRPELEAFVQSFGHLPVLEPKEVRGVGLEDLPFDAAEQRSLKMVDGHATLASLRERLGDWEDALAGTRALAFAVRAGFLGFGEDPLLIAERKEAAALETELEKRLKRASAFELFGISEETSDEAVRSAYLGEVKKYHPDGIRATAAPELLEVRRQIFLLVQNAYDQVRTAEARREHSVLVAQGMKDKEEEQRKVRAILEAEELFMTSEALARAKKWEEAFQTICRAIDLNPEDAELPLFRAFYRWMKDGRSKSGAHRAIREIRELLDKGGKEYASAHLFLGKLLKRVEQPEESIRHFKKVLEFDPRHHEAQSEIRLATMRTGKDKKEKKGWFR